MTDIRSLPLKSDKMKAMLEQLERAMPDHIKLMAILARSDMEKVKSYVNAGFTREEAIDLLKAEKIKVHLK